MHPNSQTVVLFDQPTSEPTPKGRISVAITKQRLATEQGKRTTKVWVLIDE